jgi:hypothetical protein
MQDDFNSEKETNTAFNDTALNLALSLTIMFVIAMLLMAQVKNLKTSEADVKVNDDFLITLDWNNKSGYDMDIHVRNPLGETVWFRKQDAPWATLERDDLGRVSDMMLVDGEVNILEVNREVIHLHNMIPGEYTINVHYYHNDNMLDVPPQDIHVEFLQLKPYYKILYTKLYPIQLEYKQEYTLFSFTYEKNQSIFNVDTQTQIPFIFDEMMNMPQGAGP